MRNLASTLSAPAHRLGARATAIATAAILGLAATSTVAHAEGPVKIVAPASAQASQQVRFAAAASAGTKLVSFFVDGQRRWVDTSPRWEFGRDGYLPTDGMSPGRHELMVKAQGRRGTATTRRTMFVARRTSTRGSQQSAPTAASTPSATAPEAKTPASAPSASAKPKPAPAPAPTPSPAPAPAPTPAPTPTPAPAPAPNPAPAPSSAALLDAGFESNLANWNIAGVGEVVPTVTTTTVRSGAKACQVKLTGSQNRSELILGGNGGGSTTGTVEFHEGDEYWYGFSLDIQQMVYGKPGAHNLFMQFKSDGEGSPAWGLQLWDTAGKKGLWTAGKAMQIGSSGERFLAPISERQWHDVVVHFKASSTGNGFYEVYLDGALVDSRSGVSMIVPGHSAAYIKNGLYRNGGTAPGTSEIALDAAKLGTSQSAVAPS